MKVMLTGDAAGGITWVDVSAFDIVMTRLFIDSSGSEVMRPVLTLESCEDLILFQDVMSAKIEKAGVKRTVVGTGEIVPYVCCVE